MLRIYRYISLTVFLLGLGIDIAHAGPLLELAREHPEIFDGPAMPLKTPCNDGSGLRDCFAYSLTESGLSASTSATVAAITFTLLYAVLIFGAYWAFRNRSSFVQKTKKVYQSRLFRGIFIFYLLWAPFSFFAATGWGVFVIILMAPITLFFTSRALISWYRKGE